MRVSAIDVIIRAQDGAPSAEQLRALAAQQLADAPQARVADVLFPAGKDRLQALNACMEQRLDEADCFVVVDAQALQSGALRSVLRYLPDAQADVLYGCAPALTDAGQRRNARNAYVCARGVVYVFGEKAVQRMRSADTRDLVREVLSDRAVCAQPMPDEVWGGARASAPVQKLLLLRYACTLRGALIAAAAAGLVGTIVFLCLLLYNLCALHRWDVVSGVGCIAFAHVFFWSLGALLILWYRRSEKQGLQAREHPFWKESRLQ